MPKSKSPQRVQVRTARAGLTLTLTLTLTLACSSSESAPQPSTAAGASGAAPPSAAGATGATGATSASAGVSGADGRAQAGASAPGGATEAAGTGAIGSLAGMGAAGAGASGAGAAGTEGAADAGASAGAPADAGAAGDPAEPDAATRAEAELWISPQGDDSNPGSEALPLLSLAVAVERAMPGMTIWVAPGTYRSAQTVSLAAEGSQELPIRIFARAAERPVFDFAEQPRGESSARGLQISGSHWHLRGFDVKDAGDNCIHISGSHNLIERVNTYGCSDTGVQISANSAEAGDPARAAHNTVLNCDSHDNYDAANQGENADGFAAKLYIGPGNVFRGCRAWNNADDGWDLFASDDVVIIEDCWAISNGKIGPNQNNTNGDGNGFKLGGAARAGDANMGGAPHRVTGCLSIENRTCGFVLNNNTSTPVLEMCGGRGDGRGTLCSLTNRGNVAVTLTAAQAIAAERDADGNLPKL